jgi:hypothetical protein
MPDLTRRLDPDHRQEWWEIYYSDIHVGRIIERAVRETPSACERANSGWLRQLSNCGTVAG